MKFQTIAIVGVGLIGGSIGLAVKKRGLAKTVLGVGRNSLSLDVALERHAIDEACLDLAPAAARADLVIFCTPVDHIVEQVLAAARFCRPGTLLTDAGSTKAGIVMSLEEHLPEASFVGSHPLAGSEKRGPEHADADLFEKRVTVVTRTNRTEADAFERVVEFWQALGSRVIVMDPHDHDRALACTSHLPHLVAAALASTLPPELYQLTATGFRDTTRIGAGDPELWSAIFAQNRARLLEALASFEERLGCMRTALTDSDWATVQQLLIQAKKVCDALGN
jgi:prephenate dehydrogenase